MRPIQVSNVLDFKDGNGLWVRSYNPSTNIQHTTRAGSLWSGINMRCKVGGSCQARRPTYVGTTNGFKDFQEFAEWCQHQYGYVNKESNGKFWQLDKDLKIQGNKVYSPETCIFVPNRINSLLTSCDSSRGSTPLGVCWHKGNMKFNSKCRDKINGRRDLGCFDSELEAHQAWQRYKIDLIRRIIIEDAEIRNHLELVPILLAQAQRIEDDLLNNRETK